jgi:hypothetical protein
VYKYFTWTDNEGYFRGQQLLHKSQIAVLLEHTKKPSEAFATIQDYDKDGNCIGCPLYFDIDSDSLWDAYNEMQELVQDLRASLEIDPLVWFSGSKGFHVVCPIYIRHERCHEIVKMMIDDVTDIGDRSVYRTRSMWRCDSSWNAKGNGYKVAVNPLSALQDMKTWSTENIHYPITQNWVGIRDANIEKYIPKLPTFTERMSEIGDDFMKDFKPCMKTIWEMESPPEGYRHQFLHIMARHCYRSGLSSSEAIKLFAYHHFWKTVNARDYEKVISSVYRSGHGLIGCKKGRDSELLTQYCSKACNLNEEMTVFDYIGGKDA